MGKIPERWLTYQGVNKPLENLPIVSFKTPLSEKYHRPKSYTSNDEVFVESDEQFTPSQLYDKLLDDGYTLDTVVDLTFTYRYYDGALFARGYDLHYEKIMCAGQQLPNEDVVYKVADVINEFIHENGKDTTKLLGIHCTHGVNRTGYIVCRYLIEWLGYEPEVAIKAFNKSRGHDIERTVYLEDLRRRTPKNGYKTWESQRGDKDQTENEEIERGYSERQNNPAYSDDRCYYEDDDYNGKDFYVKRREDYRERHYQRNQTTYHERRSYGNTGHSGYGYDGHRNYRYGEQRDYGYADSRRDNHRRENSEWRERDNYESKANRDRNANMKK